MPVQQDGDRHVYSTALSVFIFPLDTIFMNHCDGTTTSFWSVEEEQKKRGQRLQILHASMTSSPPRGWTYLADQNAALTVTESRSAKYYSRACYISNITEHPLRLLLSPA